jgi:endonuclease G
MSKGRSRGAGTGISPVARVITLLIAAAALGYLPVKSGFLDELLGRFGEHPVARHAGERSAPAGSTPVSLPRSQGFSACQQLFPKGALIDVATVGASWRPTALCLNHFAVLYSRLSKTPLVAVERLTRQQLADALDEKRTNEFFPDPRLSREERAELKDFQGSGLDRGHLAPAGDQPDQASMAQSFALSNMVPQDPVNNRKVWSGIESDLRKFVRRSQGNVFVFTGPIFRGQPQTIGPNKVWVPTHLFKLVYDEATGRSWAYVLPNTAQAHVEPPMAYDEFVRQTGWQLLPAKEPARSVVNAR